MLWSTYVPAKSSGPSGSLQAATAKSTTGAVIFAIVRIIPTNLVNSCLVAQAKGTRWVLPFT